MTGGFEAEFEKLWARTSRDVRAYMFCACRGWADADDLVQDCYLRALRGWGQFDAKGSRRAWLFGIARRTRVDWFRQRSRKGVVVGLDSANELAEDSGGPDTDEFEQVWQALMGMDHEQSEVIHLRFAAALTYAEIAQALGIPIGTVRSRLHRGLRAVRKQIKGRDNGA